MRLPLLTSLCLPLAAHGQLLGSIDDLLKSLGPAPNNDPRSKNFQPAGSGDVRSPCPGLNALANHNFIHHDGKNMTLPHLLKGLAEGLNMGPDFTVAIDGAGFLSTSDPTSGAFNLDDLDAHNFPIEHDSSLSRQDFYFGNDYSFYPQNWNSVVAQFHGKKTSIPTAAKAKYSRVQNSEKTNPKFTYGIREFIFSYGETAIYLQTMSSPSVNGVANVDYVRSLFEQERLPYHLGWRVSPEPITLTSLGAMVFELYSASPEPAPEGYKVTAESYKYAFIALIGTSMFFSELTDGICSKLAFAKTADDWARSTYKV